MTVQKLSKEDGEKLVLEYLQKQNRPYSAADIASNLHNQVSKPALIKILDELKSKNEVVVKLFGKQSVFCTKQQAINLEDVCDDKLEELKTEAKAIEMELKGLAQELVGLQKTPTNTQLQQRIGAVKAKVEELEHLPKPSGNINGPEIKRTESEVKTMTSKNNRRVKLAKSILIMIKEDLAEDLGYDKGDLENELGIEWIEMSS